MIDPIFQSVFVTTGRNAAGNAAAVQTNYALSTTVTMTMGTHSYDTHLGAFDDALEALVVVLAEAKITNVHLNTAAVQDTHDR